MEQQSRCPAENVVNVLVLKEDNKADMCCFMPLKWVKIYSPVRQKQQMYKDYK